MGPFWRLLFIILVIYCVLIEGKKWSRHREQNQVVTQALVDGGAQLASVGIPANCVGKKFCITVFIAPWCPVCHSCEPTFRGLYKYLPKNRPDVGFGLVIGSDRPEKNAKKQKELEPIESYTDDSGSIMNTRHISAFPTWVVTSDSGEELSRQTGGLVVNAESQIPQALDVILGR